MLLAHKEQVENRNKRKAQEALETFVCFLSLGSVWFPAVVKFQASLGQQDYGQGRSCNLLRNDMIIQLYHQLPVSTAFTIRKAGRNQPKELKVEISFLRRLQAWGCNLVLSGPFAETCGACVSGPAWPTTTWGHASWPGGQGESDVLHSPLLVCAHQVLSGALGCRMALEAWVAAGSVYHSVSSSLQFASSGIKGKSKGKSKADEGVVSFKSLSHALLVDNDRISMYFVGLYQWVPAWACSSEACLD